MRALLHLSWQKDKLHQFDIVGDYGIVEVSVWLKPLHITRSHWKGLTPILPLIVKYKLSLEQLGYGISEVIGSLYNFLLTS